MNSAFILLGLAVLLALLGACLILKAFTRERGL
jgi:hypothetical protein